MKICCSTLLLATRTGSLKYGERLFLLALIEEMSHTCMCHQIKELRGIILCFSPPHEELLSVGCKESTQMFYFMTQKLFLFTLRVMLKRLPSVDHHHVLVL